MAFWGSRWVSGKGQDWNHQFNHRVVFIHWLRFKCEYSLLFQQLKQMTMWLTQNPTAFSPFNFSFLQNYYPSYPTLEPQPTWNPILSAPAPQPPAFMHRTIIVIQQGGLKQPSSVEETTKQTVENKNQCPHCSKVFKFRIQYFRHLSDRYKHCQEKFGEEYIPQRVPKKPKIYACKQCSRSYTEKSALRRHKKNKKHR